MGIQVEFNPDLALRNWSEYEEGRRQSAECIPQVLRVGDTYNFLKCGQRLYWLHGELPLLETKGSEQLSRPRASIIILEATHVCLNGAVWTRGRYRVVEVYGADDEEIHFESYAKVKR